MAVGITEHGWTTSAWLPYRVSAACLEPWRAIKYLSHIGVSFITAVEGHYPISMAGSIPRRIARRSSIPGRVAMLLLLTLDRPLRKGYGRTCGEMARSLRSGSGRPERGSNAVECSR